jgi:PAS domain-containing protein
VHYSGAASVNLNRTRKQKSEREQITGLLFDNRRCSAQDEVRAAAASPPDLLAPLVDCLEDGLVLVGPDQTVTWMNRAMEGLFGVSKYETIGMNAVDFISLCISPNLQGGEELKEDFIVSCFFCENIPARRYRTSRTPGGRVWVEYSSAVIPDGPDQGARLDTYRIRPDSNRLEAGLREYRQRFEFLTAVSSDLIISLDPGLKITSVGPSVRRLLGHNPEDLPGKHLSSIMDPDSVAEFQKACFLDRVAKGSAERCDPAEVVHAMEATLMDARDQPIAVLFGFSLVGDGEGSLTGIIAAAHKKPDDHNVEHLQRDVSLQLDRNIEHLACLGDRIRNPLAAIVGLASLLDGEVAEKIVGQALIIDGILTELDRGYVASLNVRQFLRKHYHLGDDAQLQATKPLHASVPSLKPCSPGGMQCPSDTTRDT